MTGGKNHYEELIQSKLGKHMTRQEAHDFQKQMDKMPTGTTTNLVWKNVRTGRTINFTTNDNG